MEQKRDERGWALLGKPWLQLGASVVSGKRNPLEMIKGTAPLLSEEKKQAPARPLSALETQAGRDETCVWQRVGSLQPGRGWGVACVVRLRELLGGSICACGAVFP